MSFWRSVNGSNSAPKSSVGVKSALLLTDVLPFASFNVIEYVFCELPRFTVSETLSPGRLLPTMKDNVEKEVIGLPSTAVIISPSSIPESIAEPLETSFYIFLELFVVLFYSFIIW